MIKFFSLQSCRGIQNRRWLLAGVFICVLGACTSFSPDGGFAQVQQTSQARIGKDVTWARNDNDRSVVESRVKQILQKPLSAEDAVQLALLNNKGLQAAYYELGVAEADLVQAGRLPNPALSLMRANRGSDFSIEQALSLNILSLLTLPQASAIERSRFERTQRNTSLEVVQLADRTRQAYFAAVAANESLHYQRQVQELADAGSELARRMHEAGNWSAMNAARERSFHADAAVSLVRAEQAWARAREHLARLTGLPDAQQLQLPLRLPDLPAEMRDLKEMEQHAMDGRLDLEAMRLDMESLARSLNLTKATRFINVLEVGAVRMLEGERSAPYKNGYELRLELPIFDWGSARMARAEARYMQAVNRVAEAAVNARSEVREAYSNYQKSFDIVRHLRDEVIPLRKKILDESLLRYNGNLSGVFELLADARSQIEGMNSYIESLRDFWLADSALDMVLIGKPVVAPVTATATGQE